MKLLSIAFHNNYNVAEILVVIITINDKCGSNYLHKKNGRT
jgi:hypothetical protein